MKTDLNIMVGGEAGQGVQSVGIILTKTLAQRRSPHLLLTCPINLVQL